MNAYYYSRYITTINPNVQLELCSPTYIAIINQLEIPWAKLAFPMVFLGFWHLAMALFSLQVSGGKWRHWWVSSLVVTSCWRASMPTLLVLPWAANFPGIQVRDLSRPIGDHPLTETLFLHAARKYKPSQLLGDYLLWKCPLRVVSHFVRRSYMSH